MSGEIGFIFVKCQGINILRFIKLRGIDRTGRHSFFSRGDWLKVMSLQDKSTVWDYVKMPRQCPFKPLLQWFPIRREERNLKVNLTNSFSPQQRMMVIWTKLLEEVVEADAITALKRHLDRHLDRKGTRGYEPNAGKWD